MNKLFLFVIFSATLSFADTIQNSTKIRRKDESTFTEYVTYVRNGQTNLIEVTTNRQGVRTMVNYLFFCRGIHVCSFSWFKYASAGSTYSFVVERSIPYSVGIGFDESKKITRVDVAKETTLVESYCYTNSAFVPMEGKYISDANAMLGGDDKK